MARLHPGYYPGATEGYPGHPKNSLIRPAAFSIPKNYANLLIHPAIMGYPGLGPAVFKNG